MFHQNRLLSHRRRMSILPLFTILIIVTLIGFSVMNFIQLRQYFFNSTLFDRSTTVTDRSDTSIKSDQSHVDPVPSIENVPLLEEDEETLPPHFSKEVEQEKDKDPTENQTSIPDHSNTLLSIPFFIPSNTTTSCSSTLYSNRTEVTLPLPVFLLPESIDYGCEFAHFLKDGVTHSQCLYHEKNPALAPVWVIDRHRIDSCESILHFFQSEIQRRRQQQQEEEEKEKEKKGGESTHPKKTWRVYFVDFMDSSDLRTCNVIQNVVQDWVTDFIQVKRSIVTGRYEFSTPGSIRNYTPHRVIHMPYGIRSDLVDHVNTLALSRLPKTWTQEHVLPTTITDTTTTRTNPPSSSSSPSSSMTITPLCPVDIPGRNGGVRYFWFHPSTPCTGDPGQCMDITIRNQVATTLANMESKISNLWKDTNDPSPFQSIYGDMVTKPVTVGLSGEGMHIGELGRMQASQSYAQDLLSYRIVVVAQRDKHEDHYRLMEAFVGGALVMTDVMLAPPKMLIDGKHYIVYRSMDELQEKVLYYLSHEEERRQIAYEGWNLVMEYYRSWSMMETILLRHEDC